MYVISSMVKGKRRYFVNPVIPCVITALARDYLYEYLKMIDVNDLLYCDTDSIILRNYGKYKGLFEIGDEMGQWKQLFNNKRVNIR